MQLIPGTLSVPPRLDRLPIGHTARPVHDRARQRKHSRIHLDGRAGRSMSEPRI